jgi:hypothetical protein
MRYFAIILFFLAATNIITAQESSDNKKLKNEIRINFFQFVYGTFELSMEHYFKDNKSLVLSAGATVIDNENKKDMGGSAELQYRYYAIPAKEGKHFISFGGFYIGPYMRYQYLDRTTTEYSYTSYPTYITTETKVTNIFNSFGGGVVTGIKLIAGKRITLDGFIGGGIKYSDQNQSNNTSGNNYLPYNDNFLEPGYNGVCPRINLSLGVKF